MDNYGRRYCVEAESNIPLGRVQVVRKFWDGPIDVSGAAELHHLELSLLPRSNRSEACFVDHWAPNRYEPFGAMFLLPAEHMVRAKSNCRHQNSIVCHFDPAAIERWFDRKLQWTDGRLQGALDINSSRIRNLMFRIGEEVRTPGFASETLVELMSAEAAIELSRYISGIEEERLTGGLCPWRLRLIDERLADEDVPPSLSELADLCNISVRQLTRAFRVSRGRSIGNYIAEQRVEQAKRMLAAGMSVKAVAYTTGYSAPSNFTAAFVRATGETPREYRQRASVGYIRGKATRGVH